MRIAGFQLSEAYNASSAEHTPDPGGTLALAGDAACRCPAVAPGKDYQRPPGSPGRSLHMVLAIGLADLQTILARLSEQLAFWVDTG